MINADPGIGWLWIVAVVIGTILLAVALFYGARHTRRHPRRDPTPEEAARPMYAGDKPAGGGRDSPALSHFPDSTDPEQADGGPERRPRRSQAGIRQRHQRSRKKPRR